MEYSQVVRRKAKDFDSLTRWFESSDPNNYPNKRGVIMQKFDEFLDKYLNEQDETVRAEYKKAKEELEELLEK